ncbi:MAG: hypothetical protein JNK11_02135 [Alphaproteobacteria bacterium]|nr:hypothetical protein [Alphaproteobacteria bacterium]
MTSGAASGAATGRTVTGRTVTAGTARSGVRALSRSGSSTLRHTAKE